MGSIELIGFTKPCKLSDESIIMDSTYCRSWIHYIDLRSAHGTQKEHMDIAQACKTVFIEQFPIVSEALEWRNASVFFLPPHVPSRRLITKVLEITSHLMCTEVWFFPVSYSFTFE